MTGAHRYDTYVERGPSSRFQQLAAIAVLIAATAALLVVRGKALSNPIAVPADGGFVAGVQLDWQHETPSQYADRVGLAAPLVFGEYIDFPLTDATQAQVDDHMAATAEAHGWYLLTLMPVGGLSTVTDEAVNALTQVIASAQGHRPPLLVRFGHEMNASWYAWGEQPSAYVAAYRKVATALRQKAPDVELIWGPNYGGGYPFPGGGYEPRPGTINFTALDTNADGALNMNDDPYGPYWPGDDVVDWVGLTSYHWGLEWPWGENEVPGPSEFADRIRGTDATAGIDEMALPDFYATYAVGKNKPFAITETAALYNPERTDGASEFDIKDAWMKQVFATPDATAMPLYKMALWFDQAKSETLGTGYVDWRATATPGLRDAYRAAIGARLAAAPAR